MHVKENNEPKKKNTMSLLIAKNKVSAEQLLTVKTPEATESFQPIGHALLVDQMREAIARAGFSIKEENTRSPAWVNAILAASQSSERT